MQYLTIIPYNEIDFVFVSDHWDVHLTGLCRDNKKLCYFSLEDIDTDIYAIYSLTFWEKINWVRRKKLFEWCVGYHCTYPQIKKKYDIRVKNGVYINPYGQRWPRWFWHVVMKTYYLKLRIKNKWHFRKKKS